MDSISSYKRLNHIQALRGLAACLVMLAHLYDAEIKFSPDTLLGPWTLYGNLGVDLFFMISGYIMVHVTLNTGRGPLAALEFLFSRISRIYPLYWVVSLAVLALFLLRPEMVFSSREITPSLWKSFALFPDVVPPLLLVGWTLIFEMYFYLIFAFLMSFRKAKIFPSLIAWGLCILLGRHLEWHEAGPVVEVIFNPLTFEFLVGALTAYFINKHKDRILSVFKVKNISYFGLILIPAWLLPLMLTVELPFSFSARVGIFIIPITLTLFYAVIRDYLDMKIWQPLVRLGDWSYALYLTHILSVALVARIWSRFTASGSFDNVIGLFVMIAFSIIVSGLTYKIIENPLLKITRKMRHKIFKV